MSVNSPRAFVVVLRTAAPAPTSSTLAAATGRPSGSTTRPFTGPAYAEVQPKSAARLKMERKRDGYRTGLLLGVFTRRCLLLEAEKDEPGVKYPGLRIPAALQAFPCACIAHSGCRRCRLVECCSPLTVAAP